MNAENAVWSYLSAHAEKVNELIKEASDEVPDFKRLVVYENTKEEVFDRYYTLTGAFISADAFGPTRVNRSGNCLSDLLDIDEVAGAVASLPEGELNALKAKDWPLVTLLLLNDRFFSVEKMERKAVSSFTAATSASTQKESSERCEDFIHVLIDIAAKYAVLEENARKIAAVMDNRPVFHTRGAVFSYGGRAFVGTDIRPGRSLREISDQTVRVFGSLDKGFTSESGWTHEKFYEAAGKDNAETDIFECLDDGEFYLPGENTLFHWINKQPSERKQ